MDWDRKLSGQLLSPFILNYGINMAATLRCRDCLSPVAAYDALAPYYDSLLQVKKHYLGTVERIVIERGSGAKSLLDVGSGNGVRALRIARSAGIQNIVLVEPSDGMRRHGPQNAATWKRSVDEICESARFDLITCLWNVLGHLDGASERLSMLTRIRKLLSPGGMLFLDVNHRYNAASYGWLLTSGRILREVLFPSEKSGDVITSWKAGRQHVRTRGHVFTHPELVRLFHESGLQLQGRWVIDYRTGVEHRFSFLGNLLYQLAA